MPATVTCSCGALNRVHEDADLRRTRCTECGKKLGEERSNIAKKNVSECFLCEEVGKGRRFTFYSGIRKGGSVTRLQSATVTVFERWSELKIYEIHACKSCQSRLWEKHTKDRPVLAGVGALVGVVAAVPSIFVFESPGNWIIAGGLGVTGIVLAITAWQARQRQRGKPDTDELERLVVLEAMDKIPEDDHTFITVAQYTELVRLGILE